MQPRVPDRSSSNTVAVTHARGEGYGSGRVDAHSLLRENLRNASCANTVECSLRKRCTKTLCYHFYTKKQAVSTHRLPINTYAVNKIAVPAEYRRYIRPAAAPPPGRPPRCLPDHRSALTVPDTGRIPPSASPSSIPRTRWRPSPRCSSSC